MRVEDNDARGRPHLRRSKRYFVRPDLSHRFVRRTEVSAPVVQPDPRPYPAVPFGPSRAALQLPGKGALGPLREPVADAFPAIVFRSSSTVTWQAWHSLKAAAPRGPLEEVAVGLSGQRKCGDVKVKRRETRLFFLDKFGGAGW